MLLNFRARHVDIWSDDNDLLPSYERPDFLEWLRRNQAAWASGDAFVPRRLLGSYLRDSLESLLEAVPDGAVVGVRGFALTAIVAALALAEGRGGTFEERESGIPRYRTPGGAEPTIVPFSRSDPIDDLV